RPALPPACSPCLAPTTLGPRSAGAAAHSSSVLPSRSPSSGRTPSVRVSPRPIRGRSSIHRAPPGALSLDSLQDLARQPLPGDRLGRERPQRARLRRRLGQRTERQFLALELRLH